MPTKGTYALLALAAIATSIAAAVVLTSPEDALQRIRDTGAIRIGYAIEAPYAFIAPGGRVTGESPELARLVAREMGIARIEWVLTTFDALIPDLREGRFDAIAAGMFVTSERAAIVAFAEPTLAVRAGLLVREGNPMHLTSYRDVLASPAARIAVLSGSVEEGSLRARGLPDARLLVVPDAATGSRAVAASAADALALSLPSTRALARRQQGGLEAVAVPGDASPAGIASVFHVASAFARRDANLVEAWNAAQRRIVGTAAHLRVIAPFGFSRDDLPAAARSPRPAAR